ncbi:fungal specific transcription factor domain-containing protein [Colletotrichum paranaense]|uniref:Fungal specific transcription factor domain-containing protein n=1 Tax=Colletotrichum paranaense TaxID=1914294 RepID=A0ABQ9S2F0_9PEZI|nr:fungal specific transcription factor domain-containing protein [Colletotrichum paranaense]KAK1522987.1 fungal specific transcription factor domain-containing protein [Colletotrichum paranaense]
MEFLVEEVLMKNRPATICRVNEAAPVEIKPESNVSSPDTALDPPDSAVSASTTGLTLLCRSATDVNSPTGQSDKRISMSSTSTEGMAHYVRAPHPQVISATGACSLLSRQGLAQVERLVGDSRLTDALNDLRHQFQSLHSASYLQPEDTNNPLPDHQVVADCVNGYMATTNMSIRLFQESEIQTAMRSYLLGQRIEDPGWWMAVNVMLAYTLRKQSRMRNKAVYKKYIHNALGMIPNVVIRSPSPLTIGSLLSMVLFYKFTFENHVAQSLLGLAVQLLLMSGYHRPETFRTAFTPSTLSPSDRLHRRRLFWQAYILDHDLMLRIGQPPLIKDEFLLDLPEEYPADGYSMYHFPNNASLNFFLQQVRLARIQGRISSELYSSAKVSSSELEAQIVRLDSELEEWRRGIPEVIHPECCECLVDGDHRRMACLTTLHFTYFQLVVAIHSAAFRLPYLEDREGIQPDNIGPSLALCVSASRAAISLLGYHQTEHPFTPYLLYQVAWSADVLFVNILQNKMASSATQDLSLLSAVISFFQKYDPDHQSVILYHIIRIMVDVASSILNDTAVLATNPLSIGPTSHNAQVSIFAPIDGVPTTRSMTSEEYTSFSSADTTAMETKAAVQPGNVSSNCDAAGFIRVNSAADIEQYPQLDVVSMASTTTPEAPFFGGVLDVANWGLPMEYHPQLWQCQEVLNHSHSDQD